MDQQRARRVLAELARRGDVEALVGGGRTAALVCLDRARGRLAAATVLVDAELWDAAFANAYDAYRMAAETIVIHLGYRVPAVRGAHRITLDIAAAAVGASGSPFSGPRAERFRKGRHEVEYFDPDRPVDKSQADARWALELAAAALQEVASALRA